MVASALPSPGQQGFRRDSDCIAFRESAKSAAILLSKDSTIPHRSREECRCVNPTLLCRTGTASQDKNRTESGRLDPMPLWFLIACQKCLRNLKRARNRMCTMVVAVPLPTLKYADMDGEHLFTLACDCTSIGRSPDQDLVLKEAYVSRRH